MAHWLRASGHEVTVLTTSAWGGQADDGEWVRRTSDLVSSRALRRVLARPDLPAPGEAMPLQKPPSSLLRDVVVPDAYLLSWVLGAVPAVRRLIAEREIDCLITTGPPHSTHVLGLLLGGRRPAWIVDLRDGWRYEMMRPPWPTAAQERLDAWLERRVALSADAVIGVTRPIADDVATRLSAAAIHIPNGWDPRADQAAGAPTSELLDPAFVNVVYTGQLSGTVGRDPRPLFAALAVVATRNPEAASRLRIVIAGRHDASEQELLTQLAPVPEVVHVGHLDRQTTTRLQRAAGALILMTSPGLASHATGKLFEYLTAGRPIIALADGNEAARIVAETETGISVPPDDPGMIADALLAAVDGRLQAAYSPRGIDRYVYPRPAEALAAAVERAIASAEGL
jgi:glycosyltransferase involved in cell wall biosynthesis